MKKLFLHIGHHKTGSSSLQLALFNNRNELHSQGYSYFSIDKYGKVIKSGNPKEWIILDMNNISNIAKIDSPKLLAKKLSENLNNVIFSSEYFYWVFSKKELERFKKELEKYFDEIFIIVYLRRQDKQIISHHQQGSRNQSTPESFFYGTAPKAIPEYKEFHNEYLDYFKRLSIWGDVFGDEKIVIRIFENELLYKNDIVADFCRILNIKDIKSIKMNNSQGFEQTKVNHLMNKLKIEKKLRKIIDKNLNKEGKLLPSKDEAINFYSNFKESNKLLNKRFKINEEEYLFDDNFTMYPEYPFDIWDEESANEAISNILKAVDKLSFFEWLTLSFKK